MMRQTHNWVYRLRLHCGLQAALLVLVLSGMSPLWAQEPEPLEQVVPVDEAEILPGPPQASDVPMVDAAEAEEGAEITLFDEPETELLSTVLTAGVSKTQSLPIDLQAVLRLVERQNLPLERDVLGAKLRNNTYYRSLARMLPDVGGGFTQSRFRGSIQIFGNETLSINQTRVTPQLVGRWTIFPGGQELFESLAARQRAKAGRVQVLDTLQQQMAAAALEYYTLQESRVQVENVQASITESRSQVALNESRLRAGVGTRLDVMRSRSQLAQWERNLIEAENRMAKAEQALLERLNLDPTLALTPADVGAQPRVLVPMEASTDQLVGRAMLNNPELSVMDREIKSLRREAMAVLGQIIPSVHFEAYINGVGPTWDNLGLGRFAGFTVESQLFRDLGLAIPLEYRQKRLEIQQREVERNALARTIQSQVIDAFLDSKAAAKAIVTAREELAASQEAYRLALGRFRAGLGINLDVLDAETALNTARTNITTAILAFNRSQIRLVEAIGDVSEGSLIQGLSLSALVAPVQAVPKLSKRYPAKVPAVGTPSSSP